MKKLCFINGSPKGDNSASQYFLDELSKLLVGNDYEIQGVKLNDEVNYREIADSDILVFAFPLYVDSLPAPVIEFLENFEEYAKESKRDARVYAVVNCGFFEGIQNRHAVKILKNFCDKVGFKWRFGIGIGAGEFVRETKASIPLNSKVKVEIPEAFKEMEKDIRDGSESVKGNLFTSPKFPRMLYILGGNRGWIKTAKMKSISKSQLYAKPFAKS